MRVRARRRKSIVFFITLGTCLVILAIALSFGWIILNLTELALLILGIIFFIVLIFGVVLNTTFLIREIRRNEQHDAFINAVTHELKTPVASIRLYLETLKTRDVGAQEREEFYDIMLADSDRLLKTVEQVLRAGRMRHRGRRIAKSAINLNDIVRERSEEHTSEPPVTWPYLVCSLLLEKTDARSRSSGAKRERTRAWTVRSGTVV